MSASEQCPRCGFGGIEPIARSQAGDLWAVLACRQCTYLWRTSEPARTSTRAGYPARYRWTADLIAQAPHVPPIA